MTRPRRRVLWSIEALRARGWDVDAPTNRGQDGGLYRKTLLPDGEWIWLRVASLGAAAGAAATTAATLNIRRGDVVPFRLDPDGYAHAAAGPRGTR